MSRFDPVDDAATYRELRVAGFETFEDISGEFVQRFSAYKNDRTRLSDFVVGDRYSSQQILIAAGRYDTRSGGILPIGSVPDHQAVLIKATLAGGKYPNKWIETGQRLKYYLKSRKEVFDESYYENRAIIESPTVPIYGFWPAPNQWSIFYERVRTV
jgi:5-methylcytosine-specific restriction protein A